MARSVNHVIIMGNLTRNPELRQTPSGQSVCSFSVALNRAYKNQGGEWQEMTDYVNCVAWGPLAERIDQYLSKGRRVLVQGGLRSSSWEQDGQKRSKLEVLANDVTFLDGRGSGEGGSGGSATDDSHADASSSSKSASTKKKDEVAEDIGDEPINLDDIPF